jgi:8-oxo-dGTP diphosphatase
VATYKKEDFARPAITADIVVLTIQNSILKILLYKRTSEPFKNKYSLPGGFVKADETLEEAATRKLEEDTGVKNVYVEQLYTFSKINRDPRDRVITTAYMGLIPNLETQGNAELFDISKLPSLSFDHAEIISCALKRIRAKVGYSNIAFTLLPKLFTLTQAQETYETIIGHDLDKRNFRKKLEQLDLVKPTAKMLTGQAHRPARLYKISDSSFELKIFD